ncbi:GIN domain-containing protein [Flavobacterium sp.]|uniref:GIN domain-containing protein n=1 Tax=Flavobacterium sp. TaxID=239 RepID=UPI0037524EE1
MKKIILIISVLAIFISCSKPLDCIESSGAMVIKEYEVSEANYFHSIYVFKGIGVIVKQGTEYKVQVKTGENLLENISVEFKEDGLYLKDNSSCNWVRDYGQTVVYVTTPMLDFLNLVSKTEQNIDSDGVLTHNIVRLNSMDLGAGAGTNDFHIQVNNYQLVIENNNVSRFYISGQTGESLLNFYDGNGKIDASNLISQTINVFHRGSNDMTVNPIQSITGKMVSTGNVILKNNPTIVNIEQLYEGKIIYN